MHVSTISKLMNPAYQSHSSKLAVDRYENASDGKPECKRELTSTLAYLISIATISTMIA